MNNHKIMLVLMLLLMSILSGCFQVERVVTVKPDGSGTLEETFLISKTALSAMGEAFGEDVKETQLPDDFGVAKEEQLKAAAATMGEGVSYVGRDKISNQKFVGYKAVYRFSDINKLLISSAPPKIDGKPEPVNAEKASRFVFTPGSPATLFIKPPKKSVNKKVDEPTAEPGKVEEPKKQPTPQEMEMLKKMFDGMRIAMSVKVDGKIIETNATHRAGNTIVLADIDFSRLLGMTPEELAKLGSLKDGDMATAMALFKDFPGVKVDMNDEIKIRFVK